MTRVDGRVCSLGERLSSAARQQWLLLSWPPIVLLFLCPVGIAGPDSPDQLYREARRAFDSKRFDEALALFRLVAADPQAGKASWARVYMGRCLYELDRPDLARRALEDILAGPLPASAATSARYWLGRSYYRLDQFVDAAALFAEVALDPDSARRDDALYFLARCQHRRGRYRQAQELYRACLRVYPQSSRAEACRSRLGQVAAVFESRRRWRLAWRWENSLLGDSNVSRLAGGPADTIWVTRLGVEGRRWTDSRTRWRLTARGERHDYLSLNERDREGYRVGLTVDRDLSPVPAHANGSGLGTPEGRAWLRLLALPRGDHWYAGVYRVTSERGDAYDLNYASNQAWASYYHLLGRRDMVRLGGSFRLLEYEDQDRSGPGGAASVGLIHYCPDKVRLQARFEERSQGAGSHWFAYKQHRVLCSAVVPVGGAVRWAVDYEYRVRDFDAVDPELSVARRDERGLWRFEFRRPVGGQHDLTVGAEVRNQGSNARRYRHSVTLLYSRLGWSF